MRKNRFLHERSSYSTFFHQIDYVTENLICAKLFFRKCKPKLSAFIICHISKYHCPNGKAEHVHRFF